MAVQSSNDPITPQSTDAVEFDGSPVTTTQSADNTSTAAVEYQPPGESRVDHNGPVVISSPTPGPVTVGVSWLPQQTKDITPEDKGAPESEAKVVEPERKRPTPKKTSRAKTK